MAYNTGKCTGVIIFFELVLLALLYQFRKNCGGEGGMCELIWDDLAGYVLIWNFNHYKKGSIFDQT
jgi:hypothetical protein